MNQSKFLIQPQFNGNQMNFLFVPLYLFGAVACIKTLINITFRVTELLEYTPEELQGKNLYNLCHGEDADKLRKSHLDCEYFHLRVFSRR